MRNEERRQQLLDAGIRILGQQGGRGLTHRAVDGAAGVPTGTTSNYFRSRDALVLGLVTRIYERLTPHPDVAAALEQRTPNRSLYADYLRDIVRRLTAEPDVTLALFELRLEAARNSAVAQILGTWLRDAFAQDVAFTLNSRLPGGAAEVALFHYALDGLVLDRLTTPIDPETSTDAIVDRLVASLLSEPDR